MACEPTGSCFDWNGDRQNPREGGRAHAFLMAAFAISSSAPAFANEAAPATDKALAALCGIVETAARQERLPVNFFTRLIWRERLPAGRREPGGRRRGRAVHAAHRIRALAWRPI